VGVRVGVEFGKIEGEGAGEREGDGEDVGV